MSAFLERARELDETKADGWAKADEFRLECWPEILAVIEAADKLEVVSHSAPHDEHCFQCTLDEALDALDKKAGER